MMPTFVACERCQAFADRCLVQAEEDGESSLATNCGGCVARFGPVQCLFLDDVIGAFDAIFDVADKASPEALMMLFMDFMAGYFAMKARAEKAGIPVDQFEARALKLLPAMRSAQLSLGLKIKS